MANTYADTFTIAKNMLTQLDNLLVKAIEHCKTNNIDPATIIDARLAPDMFPFPRQVQAAADNAKGLFARLSGTPIPSMPDNETTLEELRARVAKTVEFANTVTPMSDAEIEKIEATFPWAPGKSISGHDYVVVQALPNMMFHFAMTYAILRNFGVTIGKADFLGNVPFHDHPQA